jgi:hypothetical protein
MSSQPDSPHPGHHEESVNLERNIDIEAVENAEHAESSGHESHINPPELPPLRASRGRTKTRFIVGLTLAVLDVAVLPIVYYYAFEFGTTLDEQLGKFAWWRS